MPVDIMEQEEAVAEKQAEVEGAEMPEASPAAAKAAAEAEAMIEVEEVKEVDPDVEANNECELEEEEEEEDSDDLTPHYFHVAEGQSHNDENWLTVLWLFQDSELPVQYRMEGLGYWDKVNNKAQTINEDLQARGKKTMPPSWMFPKLFEHLKLMGMNVLTKTELNSGYGDPDLNDRLASCIKDWDVESKQAAREKRQPLRSGSTRKEQQKRKTLLLV